MTYVATLIGPNALDALKRASAVFADPGELKALGPDAADWLHRKGIPEGNPAVVRLVLIAAVALVIASLRLGHLRLSGPSGD